MKHRGFTIIELIVVIVVIAILAAISIVTYNGIQTRAKDGRMVSGVKTVEDAMILWSNKYGDQVPGGSGSTTSVGPEGCVNGSSGWFSSGIYTCSQEDTLVATGFLPSDFTKNLPKNTYAYTYTTNGRFSLMLYPCGAKKHILFWTLMSPSASDTANFDAERAKCGYGSNNVFRDNYGMRNAKVITLL